MRRASNYAKKKLKNSSAKNMTEEQQRKQENRLRRWNESVAKVKNLQAEWQKENLARNPNKVFLNKFEG
jgi:hypothetical protein